MPQLGPTELIIILIIVVVLFGVGGLVKLPVNWEMGSRLSGR
jgi:Sec-independent protein translocase protein TatA